MSRWFSVAAALAALGLLAPLAGIADHHESGAEDEKRIHDAAVEVGWEYYQLYCAVCHGAEGKGDGEYASLLSVKPPDLTKIAARRGGKFPAEEVARIIQGLGDVRAHGPKVMPNWDMVFATEQVGGASGRLVGWKSRKEGEAGGKAVLLAEYLRSIQVK